MSKKYYYLAASLPYLSFDAEPPLSLEDFRDDCRRLMDPADFVVLEQFLEHPHQAEGFPDADLRKFRGFLKVFLNEQAMFRTQTREMDMESRDQDVSERDPYLHEQVVRASKASNPLEGEKILDEIVWERIDDLQAGHHFDLIWILLYGVKLTILRRYRVIEHPESREKFENILQTDYAQYL